MSMKMHETVLVTSLVALLVVPAAGCGGAAETAAVAATATVAPAPAMTDAEARALTAKALEVLGDFTSYHASAIVTEGDSDSTIEAVLGKGVIDATVSRADGTTSHQVSVDEHTVVSTDGDATWRPDDSFTNSLQLVGPLIALEKSLADPKVELSIIGMTTVEGVRTTHLRFTTAERESVEVWIAEHAKLGPHVKRMRGPFTSPAGDWHIDVTYSKFNEPFDIRLPEVS
ncbi:MAG TPA: hypothetical protein VEU30_15035 [Thermoanaerobaculia bacterium]|nr:hypothetical protein [Thermoanaerobaculia bacterium]